MLGSENKEAVVKRLSRITGQINGISRMVDESRYCVDILNQIAAARAALSSVGKFILEDHMNTCVAAAIKRGSGSREIKELVDIFEKF